MSELLDKVARAVCRADADYEWDDPMCNQKRYLTLSKGALDELRKYLHTKHDVGTGDHWDALDELDEALK